MNPLFEKIFIGISVIMGIWGIIFLFSVFPTQAMFYSIAVVGGTAFLAAMIWFFTRSPA